MPSPPRRSTRSALPPTTKPASGDSSSSSLSSVRPERSTRSVNKSTTPQLSASPLSSEDGEGAAAAGHLQTRRSKQSQHGESVVKAQDDDEAEEEPAEGADITRCICGQQEYPGPPLSEDNKSRLDANSEDAGGLFIQCDKCSVWQHGGCVGIMDEDKTPENYFCELCEKKLHRVFTDSRGYVYVFDLITTQLRGTMTSSERLNSQRGLCCPIETRVTLTHSHLDIRPLQWAQQLTSIPQTTLLTLPSPLSRRIQTCTKRVLRS